MARCPKLDFESNTFWNDCKYICTECGKQMHPDDSQVKYVCNPEYGYEYENCPVYKNS